MQQGTLANEAIVGVEWVMKLVPKVPYFGVFATVHHNPCGEPLTLISIRRPLVTSQYNPNHSQH